MIRVPGDVPGGVRRFGLLPLDLRLNFFDISHL
jgi:hypothetical protein